MMDTMQSVFFEDRSGGAGKEEEDAGRARVPKRRQAVWVDEDDARLGVDVARAPRARKLRKGGAEVELGGEEYGKRIREYFAGDGAGGRGPGEWARLPDGRRGDEDEDADADASEGDDEGVLDEKVKKLLQSTGRVLKGRARVAGGTVVSRGLGGLRPGLLQIRRVENANSEDPNRAVTKAVEFHSSGRLLLTAGMDKTLRIFQVDGERNAKVQGIHLHNFPIHAAKFTGAGEEVVMTGCRKFFYQFDMNTGKVLAVHTLAKRPERSWNQFVASPDGSRLAFVGSGGRIVLVANKTKQEIGHLRLSGPVTSLSFAPAGGNEHQLYASSQDGTVYLWDTRRMACVDRHRDEGAVHNTAIAVSAKHYAVGSDTGVVNVYDSGTMSASKTNAAAGIRTEKPEKVVLNLTTSISQVAFNPDGQVMAFRSRVVKDALRLLHVPSMTVFSNWPTSKSNLRRVQCMAFSPGGGYLAAGNDKGDVHLLRLLAYPAN